MLVKNYKASVLCTCGLVGGGASFSQLLPAVLLELGLLGAELGFGECDSQKPPLQTSSKEQWPFCALYSEDVALVRGCG